MNAARVVTIVALLAAGTAGCAVPAPSGSPAGPTGPPASTQVAHTPRPSGSQPSAEPSPTAGSPSPARDLAAEVAVERLPRQATGAIGELASTGSAVVFSSDLAGDAPDGAAPDLWRVVPGPDAAPQLVWRNPARDHALARIAGDLDTIAFVDLPLDGERAWDLWVVPRDGDPVLLDTYPGDPGVSSLVPSIAVYEPRVAWTAFDVGPHGPVSQLLVASAPDWEPRLLAERDATVAELWLPDLEDDRIAYTEVVYDADRASDERHVFLGSITQPATEHRRLDGSGLATMPQLVNGGVIWKEADRGFNMFNWGRLYRWDAATETIDRMRLGDHDYVNYPSAGSRFVTWWGSATNTLGVFDLVRGHARTLVRHPPDSAKAVSRAHVAGDLIAWLSVEVDPVAGTSTSELRYAFLPPVKELER